MIKKLNLFVAIQLLAVIACFNEIVANAHLKDKREEKHLGVIKKSDPILQGILWGNWGSRPFEYYWVSKVVTVKDKKVIDLGAGLPSQYNWYKHVVDKLHPAYYVAIDADGRIKKEVIHGKNYDVMHMDMSKLEFADKEFDVAYCISTFEHIPYPIFIKSIQEACRVLKDDGVLVLTLDEQWDKNVPVTPHNNWNDLEQSVVKLGLIQKSPLSFCLVDFLNLVKEYFVPVDNVIIDNENKIIYSEETGAVLYQRKNRDANILYSPEVYNSCVSFVVLKKA